MVHWYIHYTLSRRELYFHKSDVRIVHPVLPSKHKLELKLERTEGPQPQTEIKAHKLGFGYKISSQYLQLSC